MQLSPWLLFFICCGFVWSPRTEKEFKLRPRTTGVMTLQFIYEKTFRTHEGHWHFEFSFFERERGAILNTLNYCESVTLSPQLVGMKNFNRINLGCFCQNGKNWFCFSLNPHRWSLVVCFRENTFPSGRNASFRRNISSQTLFLLFFKFIRQTLLHCFCGRWFMLANVFTLFFITRAREMRRKKIWKGAEKRKTISMDRRKNRSSMNENEENLYAETFRCVYVYVESEKDTHNILQIWGRRWSKSVCINSLKLVWLLRRLNQQLELWWNGGNLVWEVEFVI